MIDIEKILLISFAYICGMTFTLITLTEEYGSIKNVIHHKGIISCMLDIILWPIPFLYSLFK